MDEATKRTWDVRLGVIGPLITVVGIVVGVWQFNAGEDGRRRSEEAARLDQIHLEMRKDELAYRRLLRQQQLQTYSNVNTLVGQIAAAPVGTARQNAAQAFEATYWGAMVMVEDAAVQKAMRDVHDELHDEATGLSTDPDRLKIRADLLGEASRASLKANTNAGLESK